MEQTLKITNVLADPTRYHIYQYIIKKHREVSVQEIADLFHIHPNVARLHLAKLEDAKLVTSELQKTGKGGRPGRQYRLANEVVQLNFPFRDYQLLAKIAIQAMAKLGENGKQALYETGKTFGKEFVKNRLTSGQTIDQLTFSQKLDIIKDAAEAAGFFPSFHYNIEEGKEIYLSIHNCPFKEVALLQSDIVCHTHTSFVQGMLEALFDDAELIEKERMPMGCDTCSYIAVIVK